MRQNCILGTWDFSLTSYYQEAFPISGKLFNTFHTGIIQEVRILKGYRSVIV